MKASHRQKCDAYEKQILRLAGLDERDYSLQDCALGPSRHMHYIRLHKVAAGPDNVVLMCHGYFNSCMAFFKMYPQLADRFHVVSFDIVGHGLSSNDGDTPKSIDGWIDYFSRDIKAFVDALGLRRFKIVGHSMGAFILGHFADRFPEMVQDMALLSPGGVNRENPEYFRRIEAQINQRNWFVRRAAYSLVDTVFVEKKSPMDHPLARLFRGTIISRFYGDRLFLTKPEQKAFGALYLLISKYRPSSERCLGYLFNKGPMSDRPLMEVFRRLHGSKRITVLFGAWDWMDHELTSQVVEKDRLSIRIQTVPNCGHQLCFQNPQEVSRLILGFFDQNGREGTESPEK